MKKYLPAFVIIVALLAICASIVPKESPRNDVSVGTPYAHARVTIGDATFDALIASTDEQKKQGLSGLSSLGDDQMMLFTFPTAGKWGFWMKDMLFSIDIIWLGDDLEVVSIEKNASPGTYPKIFSPSSDARYVLEVNAGIADKLKLKLGDIASISQK
jgi:uncharacterized membrane protein (UPF0127 family)